MKWILPLLFFSNVCFAKPLVVAVIDTGLHGSKISQTQLCDIEHKSFVPGEDIYDRHGHGTNVTGLIKKHAGNGDYCIVVIKYYSTGKNSLMNLINSLEYAYSIKPDIINLSGGGYWPVIQERDIILKILNSGIYFITAAGNEKKDLGEKCVYYPACYDKRTWIVGAKDVVSSNYGSVIDVYVDGHKKTGFGVTMSGTSQSTAIFTGSVIKNLLRNKR